MMMMQIVGVNDMQELEIRRGDRVLCTCIGKETFPDVETMKSMKECGYKFYMDGKIYKPERSKKNESKN